MNHPITLKPSRAQAGVSLIEVLVAVLVVALGILAMLAMQVNAVKFTKSSEIRTMGAMLASDLADRMRANRAGFVSDSYLLNNQYSTSFTADTTSAQQCSTTTKQCLSDELAKSDLADWLQSVHQALPNGSAWISSVDKQDNAVDIWLVWREASEGSTPAGRNSDECPSNMLPANMTPAPRCMYFHINL
jgi:type IV pilus assembly protein PilV